MANNELTNPCYLCKHPNEKPNRKKKHKCNCNECEWLICWMRAKELEEENARQKAEIERLKIKNELIYHGSIKAGKRLIEKHKAEAIKEFAERLKMKRGDMFPYTAFVNIRHIDNLVKEMVVTQDEKT